jgi:hypothetical protein
MMYLQDGESINIVCIKMKKMKIIKECTLLLLFVLIKTTTYAQDNCNTGSSSKPFNTISTDPTNSNTGSQYPNNSSGSLGFNWWQPQTFNVYTQHGLTLPDAVLYSPFYCGGGSGYLDGSCGNTNLEKYSDIHNDPNNTYNGSDYAKWKAMDILPEDGWELIKYNFGKSAAGSTYNGAEAKMPFFIIYNRYTGKMKFFIAMTGLQGQVNNSQGATVKVYMSGQNQTSGNIRDVFAHATSISKTLKAFNSTQYFTIPNGLAAIGASPPSPFEYMWLYAEIPISYDPCTCDNLTAQSANTQILFDVYTFQSTNINETIDGTSTGIFASGGELNNGLHSLATSNPTESGTTSTYGSSINSALSTFKDWGDYGDAIKKLNDNGTSPTVTNNYYYNSLNQSYSAATNSNIETNNSVSASTAKDLVGVTATEAIAEGGLSEAVPYVGIYIGLIDFISAMTQSNNSSSSATNAPTVSAPTVYHVNEKITGTETSESLQNGGGFYLPGSYANHNFNVTGQYNEDEQFPIYNNTLGVFNLIDIPTIQYKSIQLTNEGVPSGQPSNAQVYTPNQFCQDYKLSDKLTYVINPAANLTVLSIDAAFVFEFKNSDYLFYSPGSGGFTQTLYYPHMNTSFNEPTNTHSGDGLSTIITNLKSSGISLEYQSIDYVGSVPSQNPSGSYIRFRTNYVPLQCLQNVDFILNGNGPQPTTYIKLYCKFKNANGNIITAIYTFDATDKYATSNSGSQTSGSIYSYDYCAGYTQIGNGSICTNVSDYFFKDLYVYGAYFSTNYSDQGNNTYTNLSAGLGSVGTASIPSNSHVFDPNTPATDYVTISSMQDVNIGNNVTFNENYEAAVSVPNALTAAVANDNITVGTNLLVHSPTNFYSGDKITIADNATINGGSAPNHNQFNYEEGQTNIYAKNEVAITNNSTNAVTSISGEVSIGINTGFSITSMLYGCSNPDDINNYKASSSDIATVCTAKNERLMASNKNTPTIQQPKKADLSVTKLGTNIKLGIFPNPTTGDLYLNLSAQNAGNIIVNITDVNGRILFNNTFTANVGANSFKLDLSALQNGVYAISVLDDAGNIIKHDKIILTK